MAIALTPDACLYRTPDTAWDEYYSACGWVRLDADRGEYTILAYLGNIFISRGFQWTVDPDRQLVVFRLMDFADLLGGAGPTLEVGEWWFWGITTIGPNVPNNINLYYGKLGDSSLTQATVSFSGTYDYRWHGVGCRPADAGNGEPGPDGEFDAYRLHGSVWGWRTWQNVTLTPSQMLAEFESATPVLTTGLWSSWPLEDADTAGDDVAGSGRDLTVVTGTGAITDTDGPFDAVPAPAEGAADLPIELDLTATGATTRQGAAAIPLGLALAAEGRVVRRNSAEGGSDETAVTTGNSGGASLDPWTQVALGEGSAIVYDSAEAAHGDLSYSIRQAANQVAFLIRSVAASDQALLSFYLRFPSLFSVTSAICQLHNGSGPAASLNLTNTGRVQVNNSAGTTIFTTDLNSPLEPDTWYRVELRARRGTGTDDGTIEFAYYLGDDTTPVESFSSTSVNAGTLPITNARLGRTFGATADTTPVWVDSIQVATGPAAATLGLPWPYVDPAEGTASLGIELELAATGHTDRAGTADLPIAVELAATGHTDRAGATDIPIRLELAADGHAPHRGTASFTLDLGLAAAGARRSTGAATFGLAALLAAHGNAPEPEPPAQGEAHFTLDLALAATGGAAHRGTATFPLALQLDARSAFPPDPHPLEVTYQGPANRVTAHQDNHVIYREAP